VVSLALRDVAYILPKKILLFILYQVFFVFLFFPSVQAGELICQVCQRKIHPQVSFVLELRDGSRIKTCCPGCAIYQQAQAKLKVKAAFATDYISGKALKAEEAIFVEDSDLDFCSHPAMLLTESKTPLAKVWDRCLPSLVAFGNPDDVRKFQQKHGGHLLSYEDIVRERQK